MRDSNVCKRRPGSIESVMVSRVEQEGERQSSLTNSCGQTRIVKQILLECQAI